MDIMLTFNPLVNELWLTGGEVREAIFTFELWSAGEDLLH